MCNCDRRIIVWCFVFLVWHGNVGKALGLADPRQCPQPTIVAGQQALVFEDGSIAMRTTLHVNSDGAASAYLPGDHGFTYVANGIALMRRGHRVECSQADAYCTSKFLAAERLGFATGTDEFCAFGFEAESTGQKLTSCASGTVIGNGKGRPKLGGQVETVESVKSDFYVSTTAVTHTIHGTNAYLDSMLIPSVVVPDSKARYLGRVVWVKAPSYSRSAFAVAADIGPAFGEGVDRASPTPAHRYSSSQAPGPILRDLRCGPNERSLLPPFVSKPNVKGDTCVKGLRPRNDSDIRAYAGITSADFVFLGRGQFGLNGRNIAEKLSVDVIRNRAVAAGYTDAKIHAMAECLMKLESINQ